MGKRMISIRTIYLSLFSVLILSAALIVGIIFYRVLIGRSFQTAMRDDSWLVSQLCESALYIAENAENVSSQIAFDNEIQSTLIRYEYGAGVKPDIEDVRVEINNSLLYRSRFNKAIYDCRNIILFSNNGEVMGSKEPYDLNVDFFSIPYSDKASSSGGKAIWLPLSTDPNSRSTDDILSIPVIRKIFSTQSSPSNTFEETLTVGKPLGYLLIYFDNAAFSDIVSEYSSDAKRFYIVDSNDVIVSSQDPSDIGKVFSVERSSSGYVRFNGEDYLMTEMEIRDLGWDYICLTYRAEVEQDGDTILYICMILAIILVAAFVILGLALSHYTTKPIYILIDAFRKAKAGKFRINGRTSVREYADLYSSFNTTMDAIHDLANEVYESRLEKQELALSIKESRIQSLQNQINPHFLYNTLDSINWKAQIDGNKDVAEMICTLGRFFRSNIRISENEIPLEQELENAKLYIELSRYRFGDRLHYSIECDEDIMKEKILRLLLQPLIENSIKHGIEQTGKDEHILVRIRKENGLLSIVVSDDGPGIDPDTLKYLWQLWNAAGQEYHKETRSVGLYNVFRRLSLTYGDRVHLTIASSKETGTMVEIRISEEN